MRRAASSRPALSTFMSICASRAEKRPRPSRPGLGPRHWAGSPRSSRCRTRSRRRTRWRWSSWCAVWGDEAGLCDVLPSGCITDGRAGESWRRIAELAAVGVRMFTDDGNGVQDPLLMRRAMEYAQRPRDHAGPTLRGQPPHQGRRDARGLLLLAPRARRAGRRSPRS